MKKSGTLVLCLLFAAFACQQQEAPATATAPPTSTPVAAASGPCTPNPKCESPESRCLQKIDAAAATIPVNTCSAAESGTTVANQVDIFSWNSFVALNWPANLADCSANKGRSILDVKSHDGTYTVWQSYMASKDVFVAPGKQPAGWCGSMRLGENRVIGAVSKATSIADDVDPRLAGVAEPDEDEQATGPGSILVDQNGRWVRYEKLMNQVEYRYITEKQLFRASTLAAWAKENKTISLPAGTIELKAAWKILNSAELHGGRYFTTRARVNNTPGGPPGTCENPVWLGLVGLHIVHKTPRADTMIWSTFEHVDNDRVFFNPKSGVQANQPPTKPATGPFLELSAPPECKPLVAPTQVVRVNRPATSDALNAYYRKLLAGSVFENYRLIATAFVPGGPAGNYPQYVTNITLETYAQQASQVFNGGTWTGCFG